MSKTDKVLRLADLELVIQGLMVRATGNRYPTGYEAEAMKAIRAWMATQIVCLKCDEDRDPPPAQGLYNCSKCGSDFRYNRRTSTDEQP